MEIEKFLKGLWRYGLAAAVALLLSCQKASDNSDPVTIAGQKIQFDREGNSPKFRVEYSYGSGFLWTLNFSVKTGDLPKIKVGKPVAWRLWDVHSKNYVSDWAMTSPTAVAGGSAFSLSIDDEILVRQVIRLQKTLFIALSVNSEVKDIVPTQILDLGSYCGSGNDHFVDVTSQRTGCRHIHVQSRIGLVIEASSTPALTYCSAVMNLMKSPQDTPKKLNDKFLAGFTRGASATVEISTPRSVPLKYSQIVDSKETLLAMIWANAPEKDDGYHFADYGTQVLQVSFTLLGICPYMDLTKPASPFQTVSAAQRALEALLK